MSTKTLLTVLLVAHLAGCSTATISYQALGYYRESQATAAAAQQGCSAASHDQCAPIEITWKTEQFCGLFYFGKDSEVTDKSMRIARSLHVYQDWKQSDSLKTVFIGDDADFETASGEAIAQGTDLVCAWFEPNVTFADVREDDSLRLVVHCRSTLPNLKLPPAGASPYGLEVTVTGIAKTFRGCKA